MNASIFWIASVTFGRTESETKPKAIQSYSDASDIKPDDHKILHKLLIAYQESKQWEQAIEIIQRISDLDDRDSGEGEVRIHSCGHYS